MPVLRAYKVHCHYHTWDAANLPKNQSLAAQHTVALVPAGLHPVVTWLLLLLPASMADEGLLLGAQH